MFLSRAIILLYHRVAEVTSDPQLLCVSRRNFAEHLEIIRKRGRAVQVKALGRALNNGDRGQCVVIVSFDDGYADNLHNAKPLLERHDVPATVFVTTGYLGSDREFWYDDLERILLRTGHLPKTLQLRINNDCYQWELGSAARCDEGAHRDWNMSRKDNPTLRHGVYRSLFQILQPLPDPERQKVMDDLTAWAGMDTVGRSTHRTLLPGELAQLADGGLIEIGSHTVSHPVLAALHPDAQMNEISRSKAHLEEILGYTVTSFAYPFGGRSHYTQQTVSAVREAGFDWACSNFGGLVYPDTDRWQLPRFIVRDWDGDQFARALEGWIHE
jgi:peptidoglycan/xylan/chitin deacetylase (PgdA/CDA1 family)